MFVFALSYSELLTADLILPGECKDPELHYYTGKLENSHKVWLGNHFIPSLEPEQESYKKYLLARNRKSSQSSVEIKS